MNSSIKKIRQIAKKIISYNIEGEEKVYRLKRTPLKITDHYTRMYHKELEGLPIQPNKVIFDNYMGRGYGCNGKYVTEELLKRGIDLDIVWTVKNPEEQRDRFPRQVRLVQYGSPQAMREYATAAVWALNYHMAHYLNKGLLKKPEQTYIQMWHGSFGIKKIENDCKNLTNDQNWTTLAKRSSQYTDYWISNSGFETEIYRQAFWDVRNVLEYGHPRNDIFFQNRDAARLAVEKYIERNDCRLLLYVPTFRDDFKEWEQPLDYGRLRQSLKERFGGDWQILMRMHPRMKEHSGKAEKKEDFVDVTDYPDIQELLFAADAVITDYSSAIFDFLLTGRPAFVYATDYLAYEHMRGLYYPLEDTPFSIAADNVQLAENIVRFDETAYQRKVKKFLEKKHSAEDGRAAERVAELILSSMKQFREK